MRRRSFRGTRLSSRACNLGRSRETRPKCALTDAWTGGGRADNTPKGTRMLDSLPETSKGNSRTVLLPVAILVVMLVLTALMGSPPPGM